MNKLNKQENHYTWDNTITIKLSDGTMLPIKLSENKNTPIMGYKCTSCKQITSLAKGECANCGNPFETFADIEEAKSLFPEYEVIENDPNRLAYILQHRSWCCMQCDSYNVNYPRDDSEGIPSCINCGNSFEVGVDILFEDGNESLTVRGAGESFKEKILQIIAEQKANNVNKDLLYQQEQERKFGTNIGFGTQKGREKENIFSPNFRNKAKIFIGVFGIAGGVYLSYYLFFEKVPTEVEIVSRKWSKSFDLEKYLPQKGEGWEERIYPSDYDNFRETYSTMKEAPWDSYKVQIGTRSETDHSKCIVYNNPSPVCSTTYRTVNGITVSSESCHTPAPSYTSYGTKEVLVYETRYNKHEYIHFDYTDWEVVDTIRTSGENTEPYWNKSFYIKYDNTSQRIGKKIEKYAIEVSFDEQIKDYPLSENIWKELNLESTCPAFRNRIGQILDIEVQKCE